MKEPENVLIVGPSGCGKTKKLLKILKTEKMGVFDFVIILCPTFNVNSTYQDSPILNDKCVIGVNLNPDALELGIKAIIKNFTSKVMKKLRLCWMTFRPNLHNIGTFPNLCIYSFLEGITALVCFSFHRSFLALPLV